MVSVAFTGGGSAGHIYPGLAVAAHLKKLSPCRVFWIGRNKGMDKEIVEKAGLEFFGVSAGKLRRNFSLQNAVDVFKVGAGFFQSWRILGREKPALLFSKGGYVSVAPCAASKFCKIPVFTHESDYSPGLATKLNSYFAERIYIPYKESKAFFTGSAAEKCFVSGNPIRPEFAGADAAKGRSFLGLNNKDRILLVLGGSQGSLEINELVRACLPELTKIYTVVHQTGGNDFFYGGAQPRYKPFEFFHDELPHIMAAAELVICRSGANTVWECKSLGKPMILIPLRGSGTRGDQVENARLFSKAGAAVSLGGDESNVSMDISADGLSHLVVALAENPEQRKIMGEAKIVAGSKNSANAAAFIAEEILRRITMEEK